MLVVDRTRGPDPPLIVGGMLVQSAALAVISLGIGRAVLAGISGSILLGAGTAMVYPALGVYRFWRDLGYAVGALLAGIVAHALGLVWAVHIVAALTAASGFLASVAMRETHAPRQRGRRQASAA